VGAGAQQRATAVAASDSRALLWRIDGSTKSEQSTDKICPDPEIGLTETGDMTEVKEHHHMPLIGQGQGAGVCGPVVQKCAHK
jgi:hypothetical protein